MSGGVAAVAVVAVDVVADAVVAVGIAVASGLVFAGGAVESLDPGGAGDLEGRALAPVSGANCGASSEGTSSKK